MKTRPENMKVCLIDDTRLSDYTNRTRSGSTQVFYTGNDSRDFPRYQMERKTDPSAPMQDKPDTIRLEPPEQHYYAELIDGDWWWVNGCAECNGRPRDWMTYIECEKHNRCRTCKLPRDKIIGIPWGDKNGWQCESCKAKEKKLLRKKRLQEVAAQGYDSYDYQYCDTIMCPHCGTSYDPDEDPQGDQECDLCGGKYTLDIQVTRTFSTAVIGKRIIK